MTHKIAVAAVAREEAWIWKDGLAPKTKPEIIEAPADGIQHRVKTAEYHSGHDTDNLNNLQFYEEIAIALKSADRILLVGHGKGRGNAAHQLTEHLERKHPDLVKKIVDTLNSDLENLTEGEILALSREWVEAHPQ